jgi:DNA-binding GntR family transcriptional regulator
MTVSDTERLKAKQQLRLGILKLHYDIFIETTYSDKTIDYNELKRQITQPEEEIRQALGYLKHELLIDAASHMKTIITHMGIKEVEQAIEFPKKRTAHFSQVVVHFYYGSVGAVQSGRNEAIIKQ